MMIFLCSISFIIIHRIGVLCPFVYFFLCNIIIWEQRADFLLFFLFLLLKQTKAQNRNGEKGKKNTAK